MLILYNLLLSSYENDQSIPTPGINHKKARPDQDLLLV
jgi:hypothetical protein